jgi:hypothetical protein
MDLCHYTIWTGIDFEARTAGLAFPKDGGTDSDRKHIATLIRQGEPTRISVPVPVHGHVPGDIGPKGELGQDFRSAFVDGCL